MLNQANMFSYNNTIKEANICKICGEYTEKSLQIHEISSKHILNIKGNFINCSVDFIEKPTTILNIAPDKIFEDLKPIKHKAVPFSFYDNNNNRKTNLKNSGKITNLSKKKFDEEDSILIEEKSELSSRYTNSNDEDNNLIIKKNLDKYKDSSSVNVAQQNLENEYFKRKENELNILSHEMYSDTKSLSIRPEDIISNRESVKSTKNTQQIIEFSNEEGNNMTNISVFLESLI
jgi:hypothetical protein